MRTRSFFLLVAGALFSALLAFTPASEAQSTLSLITPQPSTIQRGNPQKPKPNRDDQKREKPNESGAGKPTATKPLTPLFARPRSVPCPTGEVLNIRANPDPNVQKQQMRDIKRLAETPGSTILLAPDVDLNFDGMEAEDTAEFKFFPIHVAQCVTITSVAATAPASTNPRGAGPVGPLPTENDPDPMRNPEGRTPRTLGPVLRFGRHRAGLDTFFQVRCYAGGSTSDGVRLSGFRIFGPTFGAQRTHEVGIRIVRCIDVEISNMEIAGWGGSAIRIEDDGGPDQCPETNVEGGRISHPSQVRIHHNFLHHNQHPTHNRKAGGYGVDVSLGAWAQIDSNVLDFNRHSIAASGQAGGYFAERNLVLKGGGRHGGVGNKYTHSLDVHGTGCWWSENLCGTAGNTLRYIANAFQYRKDYAIKLRGKPLTNAHIAENVFPHPGLEDDDGDDAVHLNTSDNVTFSTNVINVDTLGQYGVCDFDGDAIDDLFLATGASWWFTSAGEFHWTYLGPKKERLAQLRLGYFDNDKRCDVLAESDGEWVISSGAVTEWQSIGRFGAPLTQVHFGRFNPNDRDHRIGVTLRTTHAFRRAQDGQWYVTALSAPDWRPVQSSGIPFNKLRFGDFTGDGVTDVIAVVGGRWSISEAGATPWRQLNGQIGDDLTNFFIANMDRADNVDDILRLRVQVTSLNFSNRKVTLTWTRSRNGIEPWRPWKKYVFQFNLTPDEIVPIYGFAGRFGAALGGGTMVLDQNRFGRFFSEAEVAAGASPEWISLFPY